MYDFYKLLDIQPTASAEEIKRAYRNKAKRIHPDVNDSPKAKETFQVLKEAYETLIDERKRKAYDLTLAQVFSAKATAERKKQYYGSSIKNNTYSNSFYSSQDGNTKTTTEKTDAAYYAQSPLIYNLFFACGMFLGFLIIAVTLIGTYRNLWHEAFVSVALPGAILVREGWKGILKKKSLLGMLIKKIRRN